MSVSYADVDEPPDQPATMPAAHPPRPVTTCCCDTESVGGPGGEDILVVRVSGEIDLLIRPVLTLALLEAVCRAPRHLVIDFAGTTFCSAQGYRELGRTAFVAGERGIGFALSGLSVHQNRLVTLILPEPGPARHRCVATAVISIRAGYDAPTAPARGCDGRRGFTRP